MMIVLSCCLSYNRCPYYRFAESDLYGTLTGVPDDSTEYYAALAAVAATADTSASSFVSVRHPTLCCACKCSCLCAGWTNSEPRIVLCVHVLPHAALPHLSAFLLLSPLLSVLQCRLFTCWPNAP